MKKFSAISKNTIDRISIYFRELRQIQREEVDVVSSEMLGARLGFSPELIRKDLAALGEFGQKGVGYSVGDLMWHISRIMGLHHKWSVGIVGAGHLGRALARNRKFASVTYSLEAIFDIDADKVGKYINGVKITHFDNLEKTIKERDIHIAIIVTPGGAAQMISDRLVAAGIRGIWNFAPVRLKVPENFPLVSEDLSVGLASLSYYISHGKKVFNNTTSVEGRQFGKLEKCK